MSAIVFTGWRKVRPGACVACGFDDGWQCDGRGVVFCECQCCTTCGDHDCPGPGAHDDDDDGAPLGSGFQDDGWHR